jgi:Fe-S-cluster-containing dehydrogenase component
MLEFLADRRFINGKATMLMDMEHCTRCDDCVRACAEAHDGSPRFIRHGPRHGRFMVANACMHCADPVCMIGCPTGAIHRDRYGGQVVINDATCIGCSTCANNCPYHNIRMVEARDRNGQFILDEHTHWPIQKATKCDLCVDQLGGPACQRACPHDALKRVDMSDLQSLASWINR